MPARSFAARYGPVALVAGAAEGLGAGFARALAHAGLDLVLVDQRGEAAQQLATELARELGVKALAVEIDLGAPDAGARVRAAVGALEIGLVVYNAAFAPVTDWAAQPLAEQHRTLDVNVRGALELAAAFTPSLVARRRGGLLLVGSLAGLLGHPTTAVYGASKAFLVRLGETLHEELRPHGVDVLVACPGAVRTPGFERSGAKLPRAFVASPDAVARDALARLGGSAPVVVLGAGNRVAMAALRALPRRLAVGLLGRMMRAIYARAPC